MSETSHTHISQRISQFLAAIETANAESPVSLAILADEQSIADLLEYQLERTDELYDKHEDLLFRHAGSAAIEGLRRDYDYEKILGLTQEILKQGENYPKIVKIGATAMTVMQLAGAGAKIGDNPTILGMEKEEGAVVEKSAALAEKVFDEQLSDRIHGNIDKFPAWHCSYPGHLAERHYAFWQEWLRSSSLENDYPDLFEKIQKVFPLFSTKMMRYDTHSSAGRPDRHVDREIYVNLIQGFLKTLQNGESKGGALLNNIRGAGGIVFELLEVANREGYSLDERLQIAVQNSWQLGRITEHTNSTAPANEGVPPFRDRVSLEGSRKAPQVVIKYPKRTYDTAIFSPETTAILNRRDEKRGKCLARYPVQLNPEGETHRNVQIMAKAIEERVGVAPPLLREVGEKTFVDPAALVINYLLLALSHNLKK